MRRLRLHHPVTFSVWYSLKTFPWQYVFLITASIAFLCKRNSNLYNLPPVQQHLGFSQHLLSTNSAVMHVSHTYLHTYLRVSAGSISERGIVVSMDTCIFKFNRHCEIALQRGCKNSFTQQAVGIYFPLIVP